MGKSKKKIGLISLAVVMGVGLITVGAIKSSKSDTTAVMMVSTISVLEESIESNIISDGVVKTKKQNNVVSNLPYLIKEVLVKEGDEVKKDEVLAILDTQDLEYKVKLAEMNLDVEKKRYEEMIEGTDTFQIEKNLENAKITYENAKKKYESSLKLFEAGAISQVQLDSDKTMVITTKNSCELIEKQLKDAIKSKNVDSQKKRVELEKLNVKIQREMLEKSTVKSPVDGTIVSSNATVGITASSAMSMFVIEDVTNLEIEMNISEYDINSIKIGQKVDITGEAFKNKEFVGEVSYIAPTATVINTNTGREANVKIKIDIKDANKDIKPGFSADVSINTAKESEVLTIPYEALYKKKDGINVLFKVDENNNIIEIPVITGIEGDLRVEIKSEDIENEDTIVINPNERIENGIKVQVMNKGEKK